MAQSGLNQQIYLHLLQTLLVILLVSCDFSEAQSPGHQFEQSLPVGGFRRVT